MRHLFTADCRYPLIGLAVVTLLVYTLSLWQDSAMDTVVLRGNRPPQKHCPANTTFSQFAQDLFIHTNLFGEGQSAPRTYVELGAYHPTRFSNTALFDRCYGWRGLCIDMNPFHKDAFKAQRTCEFIQACVGNRSWADYNLRDDELGDGK
jgi:hypothetical protein